MAVVALQFQRKERRRMVDCVAFLVEKVHTEVVFDREGPLSPLVLRRFHVYRPVDEVVVPEGIDPDWGLADMVSEVCAEQREMIGVVLKKDKGVWKEQTSARIELWPQHPDVPERRYDPSPEGKAAIAEYVRGRPQNRLRRNVFEGEYQAVESRVISLGLPPERCTYFQPPAPASAGRTAQERREILVVQDEDGELSVSLCGFAKIPEEGKWFEVFVPLSECFEEGLGATDADILQHLSSVAARHAATRVWWITKDAQGWRQGLLADAVPRAPLVDMTPKPAVLGVSMLALEDYLSWRSKSYATEIRLLDASDDATVLRTFKKGREAEEPVLLTD